MGKELDSRSEIERLNRNITLGLSGVALVLAAGTGYILLNRGGETSGAPTPTSQAGGGSPTEAPGNLTAEQLHQKQLAEAACGGTAVESTLAGVSSTVTTGPDDGAAPFTGIDDKVNPKIDTILLTNKSFYTVDVKGKPCSAAGEVFSSTYLKNVRDGQGKPITPNTPVYFDKKAFRSGNSTHRP